MPRIDQRRLPLLVVLVAMLGVLGVVVADGWADRAAAPWAEVDATVPPVDQSADASVGTGAVAQSQGRVSPPARRVVFVQMAADQVRPVGQAAPHLTVLAALLLTIVGTGAVGAPVTPVVARPLPLAHVRRRGPPVLAVV